MGRPGEDPSTGARSGSPFRLESSAELNRSRGSSMPPRGDGARSLVVMAFRIPQGQVALLPFPVLLRAPKAVALGQCLIAHRPGFRSGQQAFDALYLCAHCGADDPTTVHCPCPGRSVDGHVIHAADLSSMPAAGSAPCGGTWCAAPGAHRASCLPRPASPGCPPEHPVQQQTTAHRTWRRAAACP